MKDNKVSINDYESEKDYLLKNHEEDDNLIKLIKLLETNSEDLFSFGLFIINRPDGLVACMKYKEAVINVLSRNDVNLNTLIKFNEELHTLIKSLYGIQDEMFNTVSFNESSNEAEFKTTGIFIGYHMVCSIYEIVNVIEDIIGTKMHSYLIHNNAEYSEICELAKLYGIPNISISEDLNKFSMSTSVDENITTLSVVSIPQIVKKIALYDECEKSVKCRLLKEEYINGVIIETQSDPTINIDQILISGSRYVHLSVENRPDIVKSILKSLSKSNLEIDNIKTIIVDIVKKTISFTSMSTETNEDSVRKIISYIHGYIFYTESDIYKLALNSFIKNSCIELNEFIHTKVIRSRLL